MKLGLIGYPLSHSFSKGYFAKKFEEQVLDGYSYSNFPLENIHDLPQLIEQNPFLKGLNVTIPHKESVIQFLDTLDDEAAAIKAVNTIVITSNRRLKGYNSDVFGFRSSLRQLLPPNFSSGALVLGTGGASKAVCFVLERLGIPYKRVSRSKSTDQLGYEDVTDRLLQQHLLLVNTTPLGMYPEINTCPNIPYQSLTAAHYLYDLVYNPAETKFLRMGKERGAKTMNGMEMLIQQAEKSWEIWHASH